MSIATRLYTAGYLARGQNLPFTACPRYGMEDMRHWWRDGWRARDREMGGRRKHQKRAA